MKPIVSFIGGCLVFGLLFASKVSFSEALVLALLFVGVKNCLDSLADLHDRLDQITKP